MTRRNGSAAGKPLLRRENILMALGIGIIIFEIVNAEALGRSFHYEFLLAGLALCGVGIAQIGDRK